MSLFANVDPHSLQMPDPERAPPGRQEAINVPDKHYVNGHPLVPPFPDQMEIAIFGLGCFWGAERTFWQLPGVYSTAVGYTAGYTPNPTYEEVCGGMTGHNEAVLVVFNPDEISYQQLLEQFWQGHNPTQGMRQGNDTGTQYRSGIYVTNEQQAQQAENSKKIYSEELAKAGFGEITTEIMPASEFYYAEHYHQQYLAKNPNGYCGLGGTGVIYAD
jgi:peptide-methionine (S)-S-oxide reductase